MNISEKKADNKKEKFHQINELKPVNTGIKEEDINTLILTEVIPPKDSNLNPKNKYELFKKNFQFIITIISFLLSYLLYYLSLEPCFGGFDACVFKKAYIKRKVIESVLSVLINTVLIELMIFKKISKLHLIHFGVAYFLLYKYSNGYDFDDHGLFNFLGSFTLLFLILLILFPMNIFIYLYKKKKKDIFNNIHFFFNRIYYFLYYYD